MVVGNVFRFALGRLLLHSSQLFSEQLSANNLLSIEHFAVDLGSFPRVHISFTPFSSVPCSMRLSELLQKSEIPAIRNISTQAPAFTGSHAALKDQQNLNFASENDPTTI